ncbi:hypothetical protein V2J09_010763 [Rumex salicifolius]
MEFLVQFRKIRHLEAKRFILAVCLIAVVTHLFFQSLTLPYGNAIWSIFHSNEHNLELKWSSVDKVAIEDTDNGDNVADTNISVTIVNDTSSEKGLLMEEDSLSSSLQQNADHEIHSESQAPTIDDEDLLIKYATHNDSKLSIGSLSSEDDRPLVRETKRVSFGNEREFLHSNVDTESKDSKGKENLASKKMPSELPPKSVVHIDRMNQILARHFRSPRLMKPQWATSPPDMEILDAKEKIMSAHIPQKSELYAPLFRNMSMFIRSYELMERTLKVYIYKDGDKPIFHQPILEGLYASEGWFMKLLEENRQFVTKDPKKAHLFYMAFSSKMLEETLYVPNSYNRSNLRDFVKEYSDKIAVKYPFWNRTGGMDHFLAACHDWALYETRHHMDNSIKALCNADITIGFKIGRDVSLPETYIRSARNPLKDIGGKPPRERSILVFYSGNNHGYLRPILLSNWKNRYPDMKIYGPLPRGVAKKMSYISHMKSSKYCLCPKGHEVNSPRVVEAVYYECIPVIISDNFVPPFFEVLDWEVFSVFVVEKDVGRLREILVSIPEERYMEMQLAVRKVKRHFLWHPRPLKYDLFHMILHSIWYNRVFQTRPKIRT